MAGSKRTAARGRQLVVGAVLSALGGVSGSSSANTYWDVNGNLPDSGVVNNATVDWQGGTVASAATWDGTIANSHWNTDPSGGGAGALNPDVGASDTGVFSAG